MLELETPYRRVAVEEDERGFRHLVFRPSHGSQGIVDPDSPDLVISNFMRQQLLSLAALDKAPARVLFIGMGAGIMPRFIRRHFPECRIDIVEIDPGIPPVAASHFFFTPDDLTEVAIQDGRVFANRAGAGVYDLVLVDAYDAKNIPFHLATKEFFERLADLTVESGVVSLNVANLGNEAFVKGELLTFNQVFPGMRVFICPNGSNYVPIAVKGGVLDLAKMRTRASALDGKLDCEFKLRCLCGNAMSAAEFAGFVSGAMIYTDDHAPVNIEQEGK